MKKIMKFSDRNQAILLEIFKINILKMIKRIFLFEVKIKIQILTLFLSQV